MAFGSMASSPLISALVVIFLCAEGAGLLRFDVSSRVAASWQKLVSSLTEKNLSRFLSVQTGLLALCCELKAQALTLR